LGRGMNLELIWLILAFLAVLILLAVFGERKS
jgi:hypothetical protein